MSYELAIGDRAYSSWSLRGWLLFDAFGLPCTTRSARLYSDEFPALLAEFAPAQTVPALRLPEGLVVGDSLAIAEELASRHPDRRHWPLGPDVRAVARALAAEMHSGFTALRTHCPMNLRVSYSGIEIDKAVQQDIARLERIWAWAREVSGSNGPWLCGDYSVADVFFAPVAARIAGYDLPVGPEAAAYVAAHLSHPSFRRWRAMSLVDGEDQPAYARDWPRRPWPGPAPLLAQAVAEGPSENTHCPYSGREVTHYLLLEGRIFGFCNRFCRDKTVADPAAWPDFMSIYAPDAAVR